MAKYRTVHRGYIVLDGDGKAAVLTDGGNLVVYNRISQAVMSTSGQQKVALARLVVNSTPVSDRTCSQ